MQSRKPFAERLGVRLGATVLAAATTSDHGIAESRIRSTSLTDAASIAHEADLIITLNDKRTKEAPSLDTVRAEIEGQLGQQALAQRLEELTASASVTRTASEDVDTSVLSNLDLLGE